MTFGLCSSRERQLWWRSCVLLSCCTTAHRTSYDAHTSWGSYCCSRIVFRERQLCACCCQCRPRDKEWQLQFASPPLDTFPLLRVKSATPTHQVVWFGTSSQILSLFADFADQKVDAQSHAFCFGGAFRRLFPDRVCLEIGAGAYVRASPFYILSYCNCIVCIVAS